MKIDWGVLHRLYPVSSQRLFTRQSFLFGFFIFTLLYFFRPFRIDDYSPYVLQVCLAYGAITATVMYISGLIFHGLADKYINEDKWTVGKQILLYIIISATMTLANSFFYSWYWNQTPDAGHVFSMLIRVIGTSIWPVSISVLYKYNRFLKINTAGALAITSLVHEHKTHQEHDLLGTEHKAEAPETITETAATEPQTGTEEITILGDNKREELTLDPSTIIVIQSTDNYVTVYYEDKKMVRSQMLRSTLTDMAHKLAGIPYLFRCHRGYIINLGQVRSADGNAQGYKLTLNRFDNKVPVSRGNILAFKEKMDSYAA